MPSGVERSIYIKAPRALVYGVLTRYESHRRWVPDITESRVLACEGDISVVEFRAPPFGDEKLVLEFIESTNRELLFRQVDRYRKGGLSGRYLLQDDHDGDGVVVRGSMSSGGGVLALRSRRRAREFLERTLSALRVRALKLEAAGATGGGEKIKVLEIRKRGELLEVDLHGERYTLNAARSGDGR